MENNEQVVETSIEEVTEENETGLPDITLRNIGFVAALGAVKPLASLTIYGVGLGVGLVFGKKAGLKAMGTMIGVNAVYNAAQFATGEWHKEAKE